MTYLEIYWTMVSVIKLKVYQVVIPWKISFPCNYIPLRRQFLIENSMELHVIYKYCEKNFSKLDHFREQTKSVKWLCEQPFICHML